MMLTTALTLTALLPLAADLVDPRGPIPYPGLTVTVDEHGVQAPGYTFANDTTKSTPWQAQWIWPEGAGAPAVTMLRREVILAGPPSRVQAWLSADIKYRLYVNGRLASRGPVDIGTDYAGGSTHRWFYDARDLTPFFQVGANAIAVEVFHQWPIGFTISRGEPGFLFEAEVTMPGKPGLTILSDGDWHGQPAAQYLNATTYEPAREPARWRLPGFDDSAWPACKLLEDHWQSLIPSEIPPLMETRYPVARIEGLPSRTVTADTTFKVVFDRVLSGYPTIRVRGGAGVGMVIHAHQSATVLLGGGEQCYEFPFLTEIAPSFTVELRRVKEPLEILDVGAVFTSQPVAYRGSFDCSDPQLTRLWQVSRWAVQICLQTHHLDSPNHQEPISDPGDYAIEAMVNHYAFGQPWLIRQDLRKFAWLLRDEKYHNFHTSYAIAWLEMLLDYYDYTGDRLLVEELAPYVGELLETWAGWRGANGLLSQAPNYMFMDWVDIGGFGCHHPPAVIGQGYLTADYYHGLAMAGRVARLTGDRALAATYDARALQIAAAFERELWVADQGLYRDGKPHQSHVKPYQWLPADKDIETFSPHVNLLAVLYDLAPKDRQAAIVDKVLAEKPLNTQPWFMHWVFAAISHAGRFDTYGTAQLRRWKIVPETQSFHEMWNGGDLSHGWCSTPLVQLSQRVLGVAPTTPGFETFAVAPALCDLTWAKGKVPTPHGDVEVAWKLGEAGLTLDVTVPAGTTAEVRLPLARFTQPAITVDGQPGAGVAQVGPGAHHFEVKGKITPLVVQAAEPEPPDPGAGDAFEADVVKDDLLHRCLASAEDHASHAGGGTDATALYNGTTRNGDGGGETTDDGRTFRGYGDGDWLTFHLKQPCDLTEIRTFAGHADARASQSYTVQVAYAEAPDKFVKLAEGQKASTGGASEVRLAVAARRVVAVRFEFKSGPLGFNVYREICIVGQPAGKN
jgi:hypothetical protein